MKTVAGSFNQDYGKYFCEDIALYSVIKKG